MGEINQVISRLVSLKAWFLIPNIWESGFFVQNEYDEKAG